MQDIILARLESARKELLDLGLRNPLINYKTPKSKGLHIVQEKPETVYDILVKSGRAMTFLSKPENSETAPGLPFSEPDEAGQKQVYTDTKLQTAETENTLQHKLLNTYYAARTSIEEQGINTLYLSLGMLAWYEAESSSEQRLAPLVLIPVTLERSTARERFKVRYSEEEIGHNLSLQAKLKTEFGLQLPELPDAEELSITGYFANVEEAVKRFPRWQVLANDIELGFFSFGKFMLYHDLDNNKWPEGDKPVTHPILQSLFHSGFREPQPTAGDDVHIDRDTAADSLYQVVDADSSQILAMLAVHEGRNMVIQGPPGTGKSQTITNLIANAIGQGKKVLFVAEKMAALEVVKRRLDNIGLGEACLELHSHKANKKELHHELKRVLDLGKPSLQKLQEEVAMLERLKEELNAYSIAVNSPVRASGLTPHQLYGYLLRIGEEVGEKKLPKLHLPDIDTWTSSRQREAEAMAERIQVRLHDIGTPSQTLFWGAGLRVLLPHEEAALKESLAAVAPSVEALQGIASADAAHLALPAPATRGEALKLAEWLGVVSTRPDLRELDLHHRAWELQKDMIADVLSTGRQLAALKEEYASLFLPEAWQASVLEVRGSFKEHGNKWYRFLIGDYKAANRSLQAVLKGALPKDLDTKLQYVEVILTAQRLKSTLLEHDSLLQALFGARWRKEQSDWPALQTAANYLTEVHRQIAGGHQPEALLHYLGRHESPSVAQQHHQQLLDALARQGKAVQQLMEGLQMAEGLRFPGGSFQHLPFGEQRQLVAQWKERFAELQQVIAWNNLTDVAKEAGFSFLTTAATDWPDAAKHLRHALQKEWYEHLVVKAMSDHPSLRTFERSSHEEVIRQFREMDRLNFQYNRARAALKHWEGLPGMEGGGQVSILKTEFNKKARHKPIRQLMQEAGHVIQAIKPVLMMSPLSIANFLSPGTMEFDLVIFDEASQVRPVEALGALLRGRQMVVVGDAKQLPPTAFFDTLNDVVDEEEENVTADLESILGMCDAQGAPQKMLRWHYRSRHDSLIAVSNHEFYENRLVVFPSPGSRHRMGLHFHHLPHTAYDRGVTRTNPLEAEAVADAVMEHARRYPRLSLGVVAFSSAQREAIEDILETRRKASPETEEFFKTSREEPFFIKNLENVQGDERDVIFISIGYGRTKEGYVSMSFGPLNNEGGEKRLNVLITRAKLRCEVFTNLTAADIDAARSARRGVMALKRFLHFAEHGRLDVAAASGRPADSPFEEGVAAALERLGYTVRQQVGSQGFYLDLAIVDPNHPGRYLLGIECDGAAYHSARSARDRDRLRQQVLEGIGWQIHRIWSTDWFRAPDRELKRVVEAIEKSKNTFHSEAGREEDVLIERAIPREVVAEEEAGLPEYKTAILHPEIRSKELHQHTIGKLASWIEAVVRVESPVHFEEVARRMVEAAGITRMGSRIRAQLELAVRFAEGDGRVVKKGEFLWSPEMETPVLRRRKTFPPSLRKIRLIAPEELQLAIEKVVMDAVAIGTEAAVREVATLFGFQRLTEEMREEILAGIERSVIEKKAVREGEVLRIG